MDLSLDFKWTSDKISNGIQPWFQMEFSLDFKWTPALISNGPQPWFQMDLSPDFKWTPALLSHGPQPWFQMDLSLDFKSTSAMISNRPQPLASAPLEITLHTHSDYKPFLQRELVLTTLVQGTAIRGQVGSRNPPYKPGRVAESVYRGPRMQEIWSLVPGRVKPMTLSN